MGFNLSPVPKLQFIDTNGKPFGAGKLYSYVAGTSTPQATYADNIGTANANPVILDAAGRATVYLGANAYKFILKDADDNTVFTQDNVVANFVTLTGIETLQNKTLDDTNSITVKDSLFIVEAAGATTAKFRFGAGLITAGNTRIILVPDANLTLAGLEIKNVFTARQEWGQGADVASANDLTLGNDGNIFRITGSTQINAMTTANWAKGSVVILLFENFVTVKHNTTGSAGTARFALQNSTDFVAQPGDALMLYQEINSGNTYWREISRELANPNPSVIQTAISTLTDAQIKTLPSAGVQVIAAPGSGKYVKVLGWAAQMDLSGGVYTNVDPTAVLALDIAGLTVSFAQYTKGVKIFNGSADKYMSHMAGGSQTASATETAGLLSSFENQAVLITAGNGALGNFTGGNSANTLRVTITYTIESTS